MAAAFVTSERARGGGVQTGLPGGLKLGQKKVTDCLKFTCCPRKTEMASWDVKDSAGEAGRT